ncbi:FeoA family protein [Spirillospora sp. NPDC000708]|uniref:FeoA family protein n=1 Tax=Actinomadura nitritigenes TaxID=134602 RepID=UPI0033570CD4
MSQDAVASRWLLGTHSPTPANPPARPLADVPPGSRVRVLEVISTGADAVGRRLGALGFTPGTVVEVVRRAPLGDPVIYRLKDYEVCLRRTEAARIRTRETAK